MAAAEVSPGSLSSWLVRSPGSGLALHEPQAEIGAFEGEPIDRQSATLRPVVREKETTSSGVEHVLPSYDLVWKITKNKRKVAKDTVQGVSQKPSVFWKETLKRKLAKVGNQQGLPRDGAVATDTIIIISLTGRPGRKIERQFNGTRVDWQFVEGKLAEYSALHSPNKVLKVELALNFATQHTRKHKSGSTTQVMRSELDDLLQAEESSSGSKSSWPATYEKFRCAGVGCPNAGHYCFCEPLTGQHYALQPQDLQVLGKNGIMSHESVPAELRSILQKRFLSRKKRKAGALEVHDIDADQHPAAKTSRGTHLSASSVKSPISQSYSPSTWATGFAGLEEMVIAYSQWHQGRTNNASWILDTQKAAEVSTDEALDLRQIGHEVGHEFFVQRGVKEGTARRWVGEVPRWIRMQKQAEVTRALSSPVLL